MRLSGPVLAAIDLSESSDEALRQGASLARALHTRLVVCHVLPDLSAIRPLFPQLAASDSRALTDMAERVRSTVRDRLMRVVGLPDPADEVVIEIGSPHAGLRAAAERHGAGVIALGPGSTAARVAHHAPWAVLVARAEPVGGDILAATDFSNPALPAVETAVQEASRRGLSLRLMNVVDLAINASVAGLGPEGLLPIGPKEMDEFVASVQRDLQAALNQFSARGDTVVAHGPAAAAIVETANRPPARLVVMGTHGRTGISRLLLGSVAAAVMRDAPCSVLVVPLNDTSAVSGVSPA